MTTTAAEKVGAEQNPAADKNADKRKALGRGLDSLLPAMRW